MSEITHPRDLLVEELKDLYSAENQLVKALPKMARAAGTPELQKAFRAHVEQTKTHAKRLETIMAQLEESPRGKKCLAMEGLIKEGKEVMQEDASPGILDLALIGAAQKVEHYEIASYGTARTLAQLAGEKQVARLLQQTLDEEGKTDKLLTAIAARVEIEEPAEAD